MPGYQEWGNVDYCEPFHFWSGVNTDNYDERCKHKPGKCAGPLCVALQLSDWNTGVIDRIAKLIPVGDLAHSCDRCRSPINREWLRIAAQGTVNIELSRDFNSTTHGDIIFAW